MKLYYSKGACSLAVRILINELNIPCEYLAVNLKTKEMENGKNFYDINPKGAVPTLELENNIFLTENAVIHQYLAEKHQAHQLLPNPSDFNRYRILEWLNFITTELHKGFGPLFNSNLSQEVKDKIFIPLLINKFSYVDKKLEKNKYLMGDEYTLPDGYLVVMLIWAKALKVDLAKLSNLSRYHQQLLQRKSIQKSLKEEGIA